MNFEYDYFPNNYNITYNLNGGTNNSANPSTYNVLYGVTLQNPTRSGYRFDGWYEGNTRIYGINQGANATFSSSTDLYNKLASRRTGNVTLEARWTPLNFNVTYIPNGGSGSNQMQTVMHGSKWTTKGNIFSKPGHKLSSWNTKPDGTGKKYDLNQSYMWSEESNLTLYAQWEKKEVYLSVEGYLDGIEYPSLNNYGTFDLYLDNFLLADDITEFHQRLPYGVKYEIKDIRPATGKHYVGAYVGSISGTLTEESKYISLEFRTNTYKVVFDGNGATSGSTPTQQFTYDTPQKLNSNGFNRTGYTFAGWATSATGNVVYKDGVTVNNLTATNNGTVSLFAKWTPNKYTVTYNANGGSGSMPTDTVFYDSNYIIKANGFTKPGYAFTGWNEKPDGSGKSWTDFVGKPWKWTYTKNVTLYAQWTPNKYNVTYVPNGGNGSNVEQSVTFDSAWTTKGAIFNRPGYTQTSWNTAANGSGKTYPLNTNQGPWKNASGLTLYAQYTPHVLTIRYHLNGAKDNPNDGNFSGGDPALTMTYNYKDGLPSYGLADLTNDRITPPTGYHIQGTWNTKANRSGSAFNFTTVYKLDQLNPAILNGNASVDLYGQYDPNKYTIVFDGNGSTGGTTPSINTKYDQAATIPQNGFVKGPFEFIEWNTKPDGSGQSFKPGDKVSNLTSKDGDTVIIYAIWEEQVKVIYEGNGSTSGTRKVEQVDRSLLDTEYNYTVHKNSGYTAYAKTKHQFDGWWWDADGKYEENNASYFRDKKENKVTWEELMKHAVPAVKMSFRSVGFAALNEIKAANEMKEVTMYAQWDKAPTIEIPKDSKNLRTFYEGQTITEKDLVKTLKLQDIEDDITHKPLSARVVKIEYATGRLDNGNKLPGYTESYKNGMTSSDHLDTWFLEIEKNATVTHKVTYEVTDSAGNVTQAVGEVYVKYNQFPVIQTEDRYFTLEEANAGKITAEEILNKPLADGTLSVNDPEEGDFTTVGPNPKQVKLLDFNPEEFKNFKEGGYRKVTLHTQDTFGPNGKGKETVRQITIHVVDDGEIPDVNKAKQVRFIDKKNYDKNKDVISKAPMTESQMEARNNNGGLHVNSVWYHDADYRKVIENTFNKKDGKCYNYTMEQVDQMKVYVEQHGLGNMKEADALANFANQFLK